MIQLGKHSIAGKTKIYMKKRLFYFSDLYYKDLCFILTSNRYIYELIEEILIEKNIV